MKGAPIPPELPWLAELEDKDVLYSGSPAPGLHLFGQVRPMGRIRAYTSAGLSPFAGRGAPSEFLLLGHVHLDASGRIARIEGFNGQEGERWAKRAGERAQPHMAPGGVVQPLTPLRACPHTGIR